MLTFAVKLTPI